MPAKYGHHSNKKALHSNEEWQRGIQNILASISSGVQIFFFVNIISKCEIVVKLKSDEGGGVL